jgi:O-antigen/teichoic acid export membrane protein
MKSEFAHVDSYEDTKANFFRQSGWMMAANMICGVFMATAAFLAIKGLTPKTDYPVYATILRVFVLTSIPAAAMQTLLAQQIAAAVTEQAQHDASATARGVLKITIGFWFVLLVAALANRERILLWLQASNPNLVWGAMFLILGSLLWPLFLGFLQGQQSFFAFGCSTILNGFSRFASIFVGIKIFQIGANGATYAALLGFVIAVLVAIWPARHVFTASPGTFDWIPFLKRAGLLAAAAGSTLFLTNVDLLLVQGNFPSEVSGFYAAAETIGIAIVMLCVPVAAVMFPKIVRSRATASSSDALNLALAGTILIGGAAAIFCSIWPMFPLRILAPNYLEAAPLLPWFMWAMIPVTVYNVLINNLIARERWGIIPWSAILPIAYAITLYLFLTRTHLPPFAAFKRVIQILMAFSTALMLISIYFSRQAAAEEASSAGGGENRYRPTDAKPS